MGGEGEQGDPGGVGGGTHRFSHEEKARVGWSGSGGAIAGGVGGVDEVVLENRQLQ